MNSVRIVIFAKAPLPGQAKTRLIPSLGAEGAASLAGQLLNHCVSEALAAKVGTAELCVSPSVELPVWRCFSIPPTVMWTEQGGGGLGERLARAAQRVTDEGESMLLIGTDCPELTAHTLRDAARALDHSDACIVPVSDGGYALLGVKQYLPSLFFDMPWSTAAVASLTRERIMAAGLSLCELPVLNDIDEPADLHYLPDFLKSGLPLDGIL